MELWQSHWKTYFAIPEILSRDCRAQLANGNLCVQIFFMNLLVAFRRERARAMLVNHAGMDKRGCTSYTESFTIKRSQFSKHMQGIAIDGTEKGATPEETFEAALKFRWKDEAGNIHQFGGLGLYDTFVHLDGRPVGPDGPAIWDFRT